MFFIQIHFLDLKKYLDVKGLLRKRVDYFTKMAHLLKQMIHLYTYYYSDSQSSQIYFCLRFNIPFLDYTIMS